MERLAIHGGPKVRVDPPPYREAMGPEERAAVTRVLEHYERSRTDPPYEGHFQREFERAFAEGMGGGHARAVSSGSVACFVAVRALRLPRAGEVIVSPVTDSGSVFAIIEAGLVPVVVDTEPLSYNTSWREIAHGLGDRTVAIFGVHCAGEPLDMGPIMRGAAQRGLRVIEDCSQAPWARVCNPTCQCTVPLCEGRLVGTFGHVAAFSTMYRKSLHSGGSGGVVYTTEETVARAMIEEADRGRPKWSSSYRGGDPGHATVAALNHNTDEFSCAIASASLSRLEDTVRRRREFLRALVTATAPLAAHASPMVHSRGQSPFFMPIVLSEGLAAHKVEIASALQAEGINLLPTYPCIVADWEVSETLGIRVVKADNAREMKRRSFNLFLNERYGRPEADEVAAALAKVIAHFAT
jgi:dTDP-4-amino-4,6-dideoxygalactose transaminase